jgi:hypothetical protein
VFAVIASSRGHTLATRAAVHRTFEPDRSTVHSGTNACSLTSQTNVHTTVLHSVGHPWLTTSAAAALWRMTGDCSDVVGPMSAVVRAIVEHGRVWPPTIRAIGTLGEIGPPAADAVPVLRQAVAGDRRPVDPGQWDSIPRDEHFQHITAVALHQITGSS